jgi:hypothetical protein
MLDPITTKVRPTPLIVAGVVGLLGCSGSVRRPLLDHFGAPDSGAADVLRLGEPAPSKVAAYAVGFDVEISRYIDNGPPVGAERFHGRTLARDISHAQDVGHLDYAVNYCTE